MPDRTDGDNLPEGHAVTLSVREQLLIGFPLLGGMFLGAFHFMDLVSGHASAQASLTHTLAAALAVLGIPILFFVTWRQSPGRLRRQRSN